MLAADGVVRPIAGRGSTNFLAKSNMETNANETGCEKQDCIIGNSIKIT